MSTYYSDDQVTLYLGDALNVLQNLGNGAAQCVVTSPPYYGLRDYGVPGQYGLEPTVSAYVDTMRAVFTEVRRVLADDGTLWLNLGDGYATHPAGDGSSGRRDKQGAPAARRSRPRNAKNLLGVPWRVAFALQNDGWILRNAIVWHKPNAMPEPVRDRMAGRYEHVFLLAKSPGYFFDLDAVRQPSATTRGRTWAERKSLGEPVRYGLAGYQAVGHSHFAAHPAGRNPGDVWAINTRPTRGGHFATYPLDLPLRCIAAGCKPNGTVLDPFSGTGTTGAAARLLGRRYLGIDLSPAYHDVAIRRFAQGVLDPDAAVQASVRGDAA